jgi:hypothetical protein
MKGKEVIGWEEELKTKKTKKKIKKWEGNKWQHEKKRSQEVKVNPQVGGPFARCGAWCERLDEKDVHDQNFVINLEHWV